MNSELDQQPRRALRGVILGAVLLAAALGGAFIARLVSPAHQPSAQRPTRPIVQIVRQQPGLPDLSDLIDRLCPSVAIIVPHGSDIPSDPNGTPAVPASAYSADGWLVTFAADLPPMPLDAVFGDGRRVGLSDVRTDPVSGLAIVKADDTGAAPLPFSDQAFPRVGQFGFALTTPAGTGCSATAAMVGSDFLADGGAPVGYVRLQPPPDGWSAGVPLLASDGRVLGIGISDPVGAVIPAPIASVVLDELIRNSLSPSTSFGFRAIDYAPPFAARLGDVRSGAGVAIVQAKSAADKAGLRAGDIITGVNDVPVSSASELSRALDAVSGTATLTLQRRSQQLELTIKRSS
ncbi:MAG: S1C family serine protease [Sphingomicrobium sp.]